MTAFRLRLGRYPVTAFVCWFLAVFVILFPKGGIKIGSVPLTWGYLFFGFTLAPIAIVRWVALPLRIRPRTLAAVLSLVPFQLLFCYNWRQNGTVDVGAALTLTVSFFVFPWTFLLVYPAFLPRVDGRRLAGLFCFCIVAAASWGLFLFCFYPLTGKLIEIPYLTVNAADYGLLEQSKHIVRGIGLKLIATYNNGNVYGAATLILLPLFEKLESHRWRRWLVRLALVLTLSRTVWAGLIVEQALSVLRVGLQSVAGFPRVRAGRAVRRVLVAVGMLSMVGLGLLASSSQLSFLFDAALGGRASGIEQALSNPTWLPAQPIFALAEVVYTSTLAGFGILGALAIILILEFPLALFLSEYRVILRSPLRLAAFKGLVLYMVLCAMDGAILFIPVMAFFWFTYMVFLEGWPGGLELAARPAVPAPVSLHATPA